MGTMRQRTGQHLPRRAAAGQALIMAVLVMFLLIGLGGLFIAIISHAMVTTARAEERDKLEAIALAGLNMAKRELVTSPDGADWRPDESGPDANNPGWVHFGEGFYKVSVHYGPREEPTENPVFGENPLERFLKIDVEARYELANPPGIAQDDPEYLYYRQGYLSPVRRFITRTVSALVPVGLTDQALWITNLDDSPEPVVLGSDLRVADFGDETGSLTGAPALTTTTSQPSLLTDAALDNAANWKGLTDPGYLDYLPVVEGPVRVNGDVNLGNLGVFLTNANLAGGADAVDPADYATGFGVRRTDQFLVAGKIGVLANTAAKANVNERSSLAALSPLDALSGDAGALGYFQTLANNPLIRPVEAPRLDERDRVTGVDRYRVLTRDSGKYTGGQFSGAIGMGEGLYIDNADQVQFPGNFAALRKEWLSAYAPAADSCWSDDVYNPFEKGRATEVILHDWESDDAGHIVAPYIELRSKAPVLYDDAGHPVAPLMDSTRNALYVVRKEYPRNGVLFAEGNIIVKGNLPASIDYERNATTGLYEDSSRPGGYNPDTGNLDYYCSKFNRRFDFTIVSGATIYIEGNLLGPATRSQGAIRPGSERDSKLALLAVDNVCLNPTRLVAFNRPPDVSGSAGGAGAAAAVDRYWRISAATPLQATFSFAGAPADTEFLLRDAGDGNDLAGISSGYTAMLMEVNGQYHAWNAAAGDDQLKYSFFFSTDPVREAVLEQNYSPFFDPAVQWNPSLFPAMAFRTFKLKASDFNMTGNGQLNTIEFSTQHSPLDYLLSAGGPNLQPGFVMSRGDIQVDALIYAQRGSWFVIPGKFYNNNKPNRGLWAANVSYAAGDRVVAQGANAEQVVFKCIEGHTSTAGTKPNPEDNLALAPAWAEFWVQDTDLALPQYHEPLDVRIIVNGAVVQNRPAPLDDQRQWESCWRGANKSYYASTGLQPDLWDPTADTWNSSTWRWEKRRMGIEYHYDATLARPVCFTREAVGGVTSYSYSPRLPKLPVSPTLYAFGAMSGA